jgi:hypothetical protein
MDLQDEMANESYDLCIVYHPHTQVLARVHFIFIHVLLGLTCDSGIYDARLWRKVSSIFLS